jgi:hypothetical protein
VSDTRQSGRDDAFGMLVRTLPVRLLDVSRSGCLVEVARHLEVGTSGQLQLEMDGVLHLDDVRVCRCLMREGASRLHIAGVELLKTRRLSPRSLRLAMRRIIGEQRVPFGGESDDSASRAGSDEHDTRRQHTVCRAPPVTVES